MDTTRAESLAPYLAAELRVRLAEADISQKYVIDATGISRASVQRYLSGERVPNVDDLDLIASALGVELADLAASAQRRRVEGRGAFQRRDHGRQQDRQQ